MIKITSKLILSAASAVVMTAFGHSAFAASTWSMTADCPTPAAGAASVSCTNLSSSNFTVSGWSTAPSTDSGASFASSSVKVYEYSTGLGVVGSGENSSSTGQHATDNYQGTDALLLNFLGNSVSLNSLTIGWNGNDNSTGNTTTSYRDSDMSVLAWTGSSGTPTNPAGFKPNAMTGWTLIGSFSNVGSQTNNTQTFTTPITSSYWLISAFNSAYGTSTITDFRIDAFKLLTVAGNIKTPTNETPEPGSLALLGMGLFGIMALRRRKVTRL